MKKTVTQVEFPRDPYHYYIANDYDLYRKMSTFFRVNDYIDGVRTSVNVLEVHEGYIVFPKSLGSYVRENLARFDYEVSGEYQSSEVLFKQDIDFLRDYQYEDIKKIIPNKSGLIQLYTGYGKGELIAWLSKNFLLNPNETILIVSNSLSVKEELETRLTKYGVLPNPAILVENIQMVTRNDFIDPDSPLSLFLDKVGLLLVDECESFNPSLEKLLRATSNRRVTYGFSGTADKFKGLDLTNIKSLSEIYLNTYNLIRFIGKGLVYKSLEKILELKLKSYFLPKEIIPHWMNDHQRRNLAEENVFKSKGCRDYLDYIIPRKQATLFIPIRILKTGDRLLSHIREFWRNKSVVYWNGQDIRYYYESEERQVTSLEVKELVNNKKLDILIGSSVAFRGVDMNYLSDCLLLLGSQFSVVIQIIGRCTRYSEGTPRIWMMRNTTDSTPMYMNYFYSRLSKIQQEYKNLKIEEL